MDLRSYRIATGVSLAHVARLAGINPNTVYSIAAGRRRPGWRVAGELERVTHGRVPRSNWFPPLAVDHAGNDRDRAANTVSDQADHDTQGDADRLSLSTARQP
jgi:transcriptional regulator with XRE-family HTH domain